MTLPELVDNVKYLPKAQASTQIEKFVTELLGQPKRSDFLMLRMYRRQVIAKLKRARD